ncbi:MAG: protein TolQ [Desulfobacteraceae bacterium]|nr:MAG: protein TolQ [Desulfobacteraceae bacterium]
MDETFKSSIILMIVHAGWMVKFVLLALFVFSLISWTIIFMKWMMFRRAKQESVYFIDLFWSNTEWSKIKTECDDLRASPLVHLFRAGYAEFAQLPKIRALVQTEDRAVIMQALTFNIERALKKIINQEGNQMERALSFLATTGNTAPFIGLFGTVWGIMESFRGIGLKGAANLAVVAPGISEALIATAAGLVVAIPAVMAFNFFNNKVGMMRSEMETFAGDFVHLVERQFLKPKRPVPKDQGERITQ